jgi:uncharacterized protein YlxW (UPF0749 family)
VADPRDALGLQDAASVAPVAQPQAARAPLVRWLTVTGALVVGFALAAGLTAGRSAARLEDARKADLVALVKARQEHAEALSVQLDELRARVADAEARAARGLPALTAQVADVEAAAGLVPVRGPGLRVTFLDAGEACPTGSTEDCRIQDVDLQLAVNTLFALGAEAVAVNGERIIATTAIRNAGGSVLVNYRVLTSPYVVDAVGPRDALASRFATSPIAEDFAVWTQTYGLGFSAQPVDELELPGFRGSVRLRAAEPAAPDDRPDPSGAPA